MPEIYMDVNTAVIVPVNLLPLADDTDYKAEENPAYNASGMDLIWNFVTTAGVQTQTAVTPTTGGVYDWTCTNGMAKCEIPASGGASANNDTEGFGWWSGRCTGVLPWRGPTIGFRAAGINNLLIDSAYSATRGLAGTALPAADADAAGGLPISDAGGLDIDTQLANTHEITAARMGALTDWINGGRLDLLLDAIPTTPMRGTENAALAATALSTVTWTAARAAVLSDWINGGRLDVILDAISSRLDADISTRSSHSAADVWTSATRTLTSFGTLVADIWNRLTSALTTNGSIGKLLVDYIDATVSSRATEAKQDTILAKLLAYFQLALRSDAAITTDNATELTEINADEGSGGGDYGNQTESQEAILDTGNTDWTSGDGLSGSNARTINIKDQGANNVVECAVEIWDSANTVFYERKATDASGNTTHNMDNGTYTIRIHKAGYTFTDKTLVVSGAGTTDYTGTTVTIGAPAADDACRVYEYCKQQAGTTPMVNVKGTAQINTLPYDYSDSLHAGSIVDGTYDSSTGLLYWDLVIGSSVKFLIPSLGKDVICTIPDADTARLTDL